MNLNRLMRRNRFKNKPKVDKAPWKWPTFVTEWRKYTRRAALLAVFVWYRVGISDEAPIQVGGGH